MPGEKRPHLDDEGMDAAIAKVEEQLEKLRRHRAENAASPNLSAAAAVSQPVAAPQPVAAADPRIQQPTCQPTPVSSTPASAGPGRPQPVFSGTNNPPQHQDYPTFSRRRPDTRPDTRGRMYYVYVCNIHRLIYCQSCGEYISADKWRALN